MKVQLTPVLLGEMIDEGYTHVLVKHENDLKGINRPIITFNPVKHTPSLADLPADCHTFYKITREPLQLLTANDQEILVDFSNNKNVVTKPNTNDAGGFFRNNEDFFYCVLNSIDDYAIYTTNLEGNINCWNKGAEKLLGYTEDEVLGLNAAIIYTPTDREHQIPKKEYDQSVQNGHAVNERYHLRKDGSVFWGSGLMFVLYNKTGKHCGYTKIMRNLTEKQATEQQTLYAKAIRQNIIESSSEPMAIIDTKLCISAASDSFFDLFEVERDTALNKSIYDFAEGLNRERLKDLFDIILTNEDSIKNFELIYEVPKGEQKIMVIHARKVISFIDSHKLIILSVEDVTQERILQQDKDDFISIATHELRTPITLIKASAQILQRIIKDPGPAKVYLEKLTEHTEKLVNLAAFLLDVSKIRTGRFSLQRETLDLCELITQTMHDLLPVYPNHNIVFDGPGTCTVNADKTKISQVVVNMVSNAVKYSPDHDQVIIRLRNEGDCFIVSIQDFGIGIPPEEQHKIFKRFSRTSKAGVSKISGTGLGLYISAEIIKQHGGNIWFESTPDMGSIFFFSIPSS